MMKALLVTRMATCVEAAEISQLVIKGDAVECESEDYEPEEEITKYTEANSSSAALMTKRKKQKKRRNSKTQMWLLC